jgi:streptogramin lyase
VTHRTAAALSVALLVLTATASAAGAPMTSEYALEVNNGRPLSIVTGPEGNLWFTQSNGTDAIDRITPSGTITSYATNASFTPYDIALGPDGKLWFTERGSTADRLGTIDPHTTALSEYPLATGSNPLAITAGPEGDVWFTREGGPEDTIGRIVPSTQEITEFKTPTNNGKPAGITFGPEGDAWFTESANPGKIGRFNPETTEFNEYTAGLTENSSPTGITIGPEGNIWFTEATNPGAIGRINPTTGAIVEFSSGLTIGTPQQIVPGSDGNLYFSESAAIGGIGQITPAGVIREYTQGLSPYAEPWGITVGPDSNIWLTERAAPARIGRFVVPPTVTTGPPSEIATGGATLNGMINPEGQPTTYHFEWGTTAAYGTQLPNPDASVGSDRGAHEVSLALTGLQPGTTYHYRLVASNCGGCASGTIAGRDQTFTTSPLNLETLKAGLNPSAPLGGGGGLINPVIGRLAGVVPVSGTILVQSRSSRRFVLLRGAASVPIGSVIDATHGVLRLVTALDTHGKTQSAIVWGGVFQVGQSRTGHGMTRLTLRGALPSCAQPRRAHASSARTRRVRSRKLWAQDERGRYSTYGANSAATVLGTRWETVDTCAGTRTRVVRGKVRVRALHQHATVVVSAGHSYLARS